MASDTVLRLRRPERSRQPLLRRSLCRRRGHPMLRRSAGVLVVSGSLVLGSSMWPALTAPGNAGVPARLAEWGRSHELGELVTWLENQQYRRHPPTTGGQLSTADLRQLQPPPLRLNITKQQIYRAVPEPITPLSANPVPHEGEWFPTVEAAGVPLVQVAKLRSDPEHTGYLSAVAWIDQKRIRFALHPGSQEPGGSGWSRPDHLPPSLRHGLAVTWNGGFRITNGDAKGGFYLDGKSIGRLEPGKASEVFMKDGSIRIGSWGREVSMSPEVAGVRQNLVLLVDNGRVDPSVDSSDRSLWGATIQNRYFVWRSGIGITATGDLVYAMGPALSVRTLAELLQHAGAVRAMELDINPDWVSFMSYGPTATPTKLLPDFKQHGERYFSTEERDFVAGYIR